MKPLKRLVLTAAMLPLLAACLDSQGVDGPVDMTLYDIVTFAGNSPDGGADFEYIPQGDGPSALYHTPQALDPEAFSPGERLAIAYAMDGGAEPHTSGDIILRAATPINNGALVLMAPGEIPDWSHSPVYLISIWRTGPYINLRSRLAWTDKPRAFALVADSSSLSDGRLDAYLVHILPDGLTPADTYDRANYASFDISAILADPDVESLVVHVNNSNMPALTSFTFALPR